ncbi:protein of unknown function DUF450 [candidate division TM7 genomosp. GTL1]|nr:protein of unknown function DUF450 [candidate division TM7 genomosp. GTL1]
MNPDFLINDDLTPEQKTRRNIDRKLRECGWSVQNYRSYNPSENLGVAVREYPTDTGPVDYALFVDRKPIGVIEAKKDGAILSNHEEQTEEYAKSKFKWQIGEDVMPFVYEANVQDGYLYLDEIKTINVTAEELRKYSLMNGDILFTEGGDKDKLGRGTIWHGEIELCIHQNHIFRARVDSGQFVPEYISYATKTTRARDYFLSKAKQTTNLASLNMTSLKNLQLPSIPLVHPLSSESDIVVSWQPLKPS